MSNPVLVEVTRGGRVESQHRGSIAVSDATGRLVWSIGNVDHPVFPRSAVKVIQALPLVESGAADALQLSGAELALACSSHSGEAEHASMAEGILARAGFTAEDLECGWHWPSGNDAKLDLARSGKLPSALHNNCSGKHSGFLCSCQKMGFDHRGYIKRDHPFQQHLRATFEDVLESVHGEDNCGTDGCSIPTYASPLRNLAKGFAKLATGTGLSASRASAAKRLMTACMENPFQVAGTGRHDTAMMGAGNGRVFTKGGAEGVFVGALPELGLAVAVKCDDGAGRGAEIMIAATLSQLMSGDPEMQEQFRLLANPAIKNWNGIHVGDMRPAEALRVQI